MVTKEVKLRGMKPEDVEFVKEIDQALAGPERAISWPSGFEADWWVNRPDLNFVAEVGGKVVGFLLGDIRGAAYGTEMSGWIDMVGVLPKHQRRGIGRKLVNAFEKECRQYNVKARAIIREDDERLTKFWTSLGFIRGKLISYEKG